MLIQISMFELTEFHEDNFITYNIAPGAYLEDHLNTLPIPFKVEDFYGGAKPLTVFKYIDKLEDINSLLFTEGLNELIAKLIQIITLEIKYKQYKEVHIRSGETRGYITLNNKEVKFSLNYKLIE